MTRVEKMFSGNPFRNDIFYPPAPGGRYGETCSPLFFFLSSESELQTASFLTEFTAEYSQLTPVCQVSVELLGGTSRGWGEIYSKRIMLFININQSTSEHHPSL